jgi:riboflavin kinase/FMN adenylyltransferase
MHYFEELTAHSTPCALTIGTFDGVHRGHAALVARLRKEAESRGLETAALTFTDMPYRYFAPEECSRLLTLPNEKRTAFARIHMDRLYLIPFNASIAERTAEEFVRDELLEKLKVRLLVIGPDFALGKGRSGNASALRSLGEKLGFEVVVLEEKVMDEGPISSTRIRECIEDGHARTAARLLGRVFSFEGEVVSGRQLGRTIGFPTLNLQPNVRKVLPANGVYAVRAAFNEGADSNILLRPDNTLPGAMNIGVRPTVSGIGLTVELHIIDQNVATPPQRVRVHVMERLRDERKFAGLDELKSQLVRDIDRARHLLTT